MTIRTVVLEGVGVVTAWNPCAAPKLSTDSVVVAPLPGVTVCAIRQNPVHRNFAGCLPVVSFNKEVLVWSNFTPPVNLNVNRSCR